MQALPRTFADRENLLPRWLVVREKFTLLRCLVEEVSKSPKAQCRAQCATPNFPGSKSFIGVRFYARLVGKLCQ
jgi:hypothetical protein